MTEEMKNTETAGAENTVSDPAAELQNMSFEDALAKLESIVRELESGRIKLDDAVAAYEKAVALKKLCSDRLCLLYTSPRPESGKNRNQQRRHFVHGTVG